MFEIEIHRYSPAAKAEWDDCIQKSRNGVFLFFRNYMDYHAERFPDHSLMIYNKTGLIAVFPASTKETEVWSHSGLTFGGLVCPLSLRAAECVEAMEAIKQYYRSQGFEKLFYKAIPSVYHTYPCQEDLYALFRINASLYRRDISTAIDLANPIRFSDTKRQAVAKCASAGIEVIRNNDFSEYWLLLQTVLKKFNVSPVHNLDEITLLHNRFPEQIKLYEARQSGELLAGIVIYDYGHVVHTQYMANSDKGRKTGALDFINHTLITGEFSNRKYYSFGISTEKGGMVLNEGLVMQKELMGGRGIVNDFYQIDLK